MINETLLTLDFEFTHYILSSATNFVKSILISKNDKAIPS